MLEEVLERKIFHFEEKTRSCTKRAYFNESKKTFNFSKLPQYDSEDGCTNKLNYSIQKHKRTFIYLFIY